MKRNSIAKNKSTRLANHKWPGTEREKHFINIKFAYHLTNVTSTKC